MSIIDEIFIEYTRMRENGLETKEALRALKIFVDPLQRQDKETLANQMRTWEKRFVAEQQAPDEPTAPQRGGLTPLKSRQSRGAPPQQPIDNFGNVSPFGQPDASSANAFNPLGTSTDDAQWEFDDDLVQPAPQTEIHWVACHNCNAKNRETDVFCYSCGQMLDSAASQFDTRTFELADDELFSDEFFGPDSVLTLIVRDSGKLLDIRPQLNHHETVMGRSSGNDRAMVPDVDLNDLGGAQLGVSRLHLALRYISDDNALQIYDLGSSNGSYINGQRLHPKEIRVLRNGDELRLGRMVLRVRYLHPGQEITRQPRQ